jgi:2',3'-cyclic-nucleotide 2'-phosphodiesterase (5'-nucleotidase family)
MKSQIPSPDFDTLYLVSRGAHDSAGDGIFLLSGDASAGKINAILPADGVGFPASANPDARLTLYHFNDLHGHLVRFTPNSEIPVISKMAWKIQQKRMAVKKDPKQAVMLFTAGDDCIGSIFDEVMEESRLHPAYRAYSALGVDAAGVGNHEFDLGNALLAESIRADANFPILAANVSCPDLAGLIHPAAIFVVKGIRVGVIGLVTQAELKITNPNCVVTDPLAVAKNLVPLLRPHCDVLILLSHLGYCLADASIPMVTAGDVELAQSLPHGSVHLIIGGHTHHELNAQGLSPKNIVNGIPISQTGSTGRFLGEVELKVSAADTAVISARLISVDTLPLDADFDRETLQPLVARARDLSNQKLGGASVESQNGIESPLGNFIADALASCQPVDLAMVDSSSMRQELPAAEFVTFGGWFNVMPYADAIRIYRLTGKELHGLIQDNALRVDRPNEPRTERGFLHFSQQVRYAIDLGVDRFDAKAFQITVNGKPIEEQFGDEFQIAAGNFVREYAVGWEKSQTTRLFELSEFPHTDTDLHLRRELVARIRQAGGVTAFCDGRLRIESAPLAVTELTVRQFSAHVSGQKHAMAGAVIAISAAQAVSLGQACVSISQGETRRLDEIREELLRCGDQDANAIAEFVALRESGRELKGKELLCDLPARLSQLSAEAARILQDFRPRVDERVRDDLEMSVRLLSGTARAAMLLLDSNLRIWTDEELALKYEPILSDLLNEIGGLSPVERIRAES